MDEFGVLVESIGFKSQGKSAPLAKLKSKPKPNFRSSNGFLQNVGINSTSSNDSASFFVDDVDRIFRSNVNVGDKKSNNYFDNDDIFGRPISSSNHRDVDLDSVFNSSTNSSNYSNSFVSSGHDDLFGSTAKGMNSVDDLFGNFGMNSSGAKAKKEHNVKGFDDLIPGFGSTNPSNNGAYTDKNQSSRRPSNSDSKVVGDPFMVFESSVSLEDASWPFDDSMKQTAAKGFSQSSIDELEDFAMGKVQDDVHTDRTNKMKHVRSTNDRSYPERIGHIKVPVGKKKANPSEREPIGTQDTPYKSQSTKTEERRQRANEVNKGFQNADDLDMFFGSDVHPNRTSRRSSTTEDFMFDTLFHGKKESEFKNSTTSLSSTKKSPFMSNNVDDFSALFGDATSSGVFKEIEGESEERRRARLNHHMRTQARMAKALADKNQRDLQAQREQEAKQMFAETVNNDIKRWAAGKEGNLRALLSSLQQVLWPECGWQQVSLTDLITSTSVKKVYHKATLCVHPDKVQQKGATVQQKYVAEKVFDLLKEAWNKFNAEEMR